MTLLAFAFWPSRPISMSQAKVLASCTSLVAARAWSPRLFTISKCPSATESVIGSSLSTPTPFGASAAQEVGVGEAFGRLSAEIALTVSDQDYQKSAAVFKRYEAAGLVQRINLSVPREAFAAVNNFLSAHDNALAIGLPQNLERNVAASQRFRLVGVSGLPLKNALPISSALLFKTAQEIKVTAELLGKLPALFPLGMLGFNAGTGRLSITTLAERFLLEASIAEHLATMA